MQKKSKGWLKFTLRWGIAVVGITYVLWNLHLRDRVLILDEQNRPVSVALAEPAEDDARQVTIIHPVTGEYETRQRHELVHQADRDYIHLHTAEGPQSVPLLAVDLEAIGRTEWRARRLLIEDPDPDSRQGVWIDDVDRTDYGEVRIPYPLVQAGLVHMVQTAEWHYLVAAVLIFPVTFLLTSYRWRLLLRGLDVHIRQARVFVINMVGAFYNTFMPVGTTGGDVLKAYYAARQTTLYRTRAVLSVIIDRAIGLLSLMILGGAMAAYQWHVPAARQVAIICAILLAIVLIGIVVFYHRGLRRATGLEYLMSRLPLQAQVQKAIEAMEMYRQRPLLVLWSIVVTFPVHITVILSATLAGTAFGLPIDPWYYWVAVPVIVLVGAIPISPQGAGVMEVFAIYLLGLQGATVSQAFALVMSIRIVQILWNLTGGFFVIRGGYHAPTEAEQQELGLDAAESEAPAVET
jgi:glycosyltransferase 2 family protein